jgi:hypothetical protein
VEDTAFEKLGAFYLGREYDVARRAASDRLVLYDSKDLTTHAVCIGMTGSGKTGLCIGLLEEAAIDGIPAIVIDPKGDLVDLALAFPNLDAASFRPWVNEDSARQQGIDADAWAAREAEKWTQGLADWGQDAARIQRLRDAADVVVYTPGSDAATPVSVLSSLECPKGEVSADLLAERASGVASSLLSLLGVDADPVRSREHILLTTILQHAWSQKRSLDLATLVQSVQSPPVARVGVMELESFFPAKERFALAMLVNNLLAAPRFRAFLSGEPIDIDRMLYGETGKPRIAVFSIAHLDDAERMFFVSLLLNEVVGWTRTRAGSSSLRAIVYMDEVFGYLPPVGEPPSKKPLLTLLKQARAFGVGVVLATQNPVDLDYKALSNAGTWFIGRLQTERDKKRLMDGLESAASGTGGADVEKTIGALEPRVFLLHNTHETKPVVFQTRWVLSYLAGPLTREQIRRLPKAAIGGVAAHATVAPPAPVATTAPRAAAASGSAPVLPPDLRQRFETGATLAPFALGIARVHVAIPGGGVHTRSFIRVAPLAAESPGPDWSTASELAAEPAASESPPAGATFASLPRAAGQAGATKKWSDALADALYRSATIQLFECKRLRLVSKPDESERDFRIRIADASRADRDAKVDALRAQYASKLATLEDRIRRAEQAVAREKDQASSQRMTAAVSAGTTLLSAFLGRKVTRTAMGDAARSVRGFDRASKQGRDVDRAEDSLEALQARRAQLESELAADVAALETKLDAFAEPLATITVRPRKSDVEVASVVVLWRPAGANAA